MDARILDLGREACIDLFASYGVALEPAILGDEDCSRCIGVIGFVGDKIRGSVVLAPSSDVLQRTFPLAGEAGGDWAGELANQLLGRIKNRLLSHGVEVALTPPIVLRGFDITATGSARHASESFAGGPGAVRMWVDYETAPDFEMGEAIQPPGMLEGDSILF